MKQTYTATLDSLRYIAHAQNLVVGLDAAGAGPTPETALGAALADLDACPHGLPRTCPTCDAAEYCTADMCEPDRRGPAVVARLVDGRWERNRCGCGGLCDSSEPCPMAYAATR